MRHVVHVVLALVIASAAPTARAGGIVLESYTKERPADADRLLGPILEVLSARGYSSGDTVGRNYDGRVSRPPQTASGLPADFTAQIDRGFKAWVAGKFDESIQTLSPLVEAAHNNPGAFAKDQALREPLLKGLIALALSHQRNGDPSAMRSTFTEILRSYPETQLSRGTYGPEAADAFEQVRKEVFAAGKGKLSVKLSEESATVVINEKAYGPGSRTAELVPGEYRVCAVLGGEPSRNHRVIVRANAESAVVVDVRGDQALRTSGYTGFMFPAGSERESREAPLAAQFAHELGASAVAVVGIDDVQGHPSVVGSLVSLSTGRVLRKAYVAMEPDPSNDALRALGAYVAGDPPTPGITVDPGLLPEVPKDKLVAVAPAPKPRWGTTKWLTGGVAGAAVITGGVLIILDGRCHGTSPPGVPCTPLYNTMVPGIITLGGGLALGGLAYYMFKTDKPVPSKTAFVVPTDGGAFAGFSTTW